MSKMIHTKTNIRLVYTEYNTIIVYKRLTLHHEADTAKSTHTSAQTKCEMKAI